MRIFLIGFMGSGKSTVGKTLARQLQLPFIDSDQWIEEQTGMTVAAIFAQRGEPVFRDLERRFLQSVSGFSGIVSCGGGLPCYNGLMQELLKQGTVIYLRARVETLEIRLKREQERRPLLKSAEETGLEETIRQRMEIRLPVYEQASVIVDTDGKSPEDICTEIVKLTGL